jgi:hypothetical protein
MKTSTDVPISPDMRRLPMPGIFISYRREDSAGWTGRLAERLKQKFGAESIFMDIDTIKPGADFAEALRAAVDGCGVLLAMIGPEWSIAKNSEGQIRLEDPDDWVRMELTTALSRSIPVIPVLVGGASLPKLATLPDDLKKLLNYQAHELTDKRWEFDSSQLVQALEKVVQGAKPKRNIVQTILAGRSTWVALVILGIVLVLGAFQLRGNVSSTEGEASQKNEAGMSESRVASPPLESKVAEMPVPVVASPVGKANREHIRHQQSTATQQETASAAGQPTSNNDNSGSNKVPASTSPVGKGARSLPAGIEVKFNAGDLVYRLASIRLEENSNDSWQLVSSFIIRNTGTTGAYVHYFESFRLLVDETRRSPTKSSGLTTVESDSENTGEVIFIVPKSVRTVGLRITRDEVETIIPIDLKAGVSQVVVQPAGIPKVLSRLAAIRVGGGGTYDFSKLILEPYNVESFLLRISIRITAIDEGFYFYGENFRLVVENLSYQPIRARTKGLSPHTYADEELLFVVPKPATRALLRYPTSKWEAPIDLERRKS